MPIISKFLGIIILMYYNDHNPPHFHAIYTDCEMLVSIDGIVLKGELPNRAKKAVLEWVEMHKQELLENWQRARDGLELLPIKPLE